MKRGESFATGSAVINRLRQIGAGGGVTVLIAVPEDVALAHESPLSQRPALRLLHPLGPDTAKTDDFR